jgi:hypothetical protein
MKRTQKIVKDHKIILFQILWIESGVGLQTSWVKKSPNKLKSWFINIKCRVGLLISLVSSQFMAGN